MPEAELEKLETKAAALGDCTLGSHLLHEADVRRGAEFRKTLER